MTALDIVLTAAGWLCAAVVMVMWQWAERRFAAMRKMFLVRGTLIATKDSIIAQQHDTIVKHNMDRLRS